LLVDTYNLITMLKSETVSSSARSLCAKIENQLNAKLAAMERREAYRAYKAAPVGSQEREDNRNAYLDAAGILPDWRTVKEQHV
jgi:hypothetical protein